MSWQLMRLTREKEIKGKKKKKKISTPLLGFNLFETNSSLQL